MTERARRVRAWLKTNKIWFETVAASLLSLMAVVVSVSQSRTASKQTELLSLQTQIAEAQALPQFEVDLQQKLNDATEKFDDHVLVVRNRGGPVHDFSSDVAYFITLTLSGADLEPTKSEVPVNGYFTASFISVASTGDLVTMIGDHNNARVFALTRDLRQVEQDRHWDFANLDEQLVVRLRYRDLLNRHHEDYYDAHPVGGGTRIADEVGKARFAKWEGATRTEFSSIRLADLLKSR
jgi:hypothetical protein